MTARQYPRRRLQQGDHAIHLKRSLSSASSIDRALSVGKITGTLANNNFLDALGLLVRNQDQRSCPEERWLRQFLDWLDKPLPLENLQLVAVLGMSPEPKEMLQEHRKNRRALLGQRATLETC